MKNYPLPLFVLLLTVFYAKGQDTPIVVLSVDGHVEYLKDQSSATERLFPGMNLSTSGTLDLKKEAKVNLLYNGKRTEIAKLGKYTLKSFPGNDNKSESKSFASRFWDFISDGLSQSEDDESLNNYNKQLLAVSGGVQGFATSKSGIQIIMPVDGNIGTDIVTFNWYKVNNPSVFLSFQHLSCRSRRARF